MQSVDLDTTTPLDIDIAGPTYRDIVELDRLTAVLQDLQPISPVERKHIR
jgi:hypothetical protein